MTNVELYLCDFLCSFESNFFVPYFHKLLYTINIIDKKTVIHLRDNYCLLFYYAVTVDDELKSLIGSSPRKPSSAPLASDSISFSPG